MTASQETVVTLETKAGPEQTLPATPAAPTTPPLIMTLAEFLAEKSDPRPLFIGKGILPRAGIMVFAGRWGLGKSKLLVNLCLSLAMGHSYLNFEIDAPVPVLYLLAEGPRDFFRLGLAQALGNIKGSKQLPITVLGSYIFPQVDGEPSLRQAITDSGASVVVLDTYRYFFEKHQSENDNSDVKKNVFMPLLRLARELNVSFILVHHDGKPTDNKYGGDAIRGASAFSADADTVLRLTATRAQEASKQCTLEFAKVRHGARPAPLHLSADYEAGTFEIVAAAPQGISKAATLDHESQMLELVKKGEPVKSGVLMSEGMKVTGLKERSVEKIVKALYQRGMIVKVGYGVYAMPKPLGSSVA